MWFLDQIVSYLASARDYLFDAYHTVRDWVSPFSLLSTPLYWLYYAFYYLTYYFGSFNTWLDWAAGRIDQILSIGTITSYFQTWISYATNAWTWIQNAWSNVYNIINEWWASAQQTVLVWISDAKTWASVQINNLSVWVNNLQTSVNAILAQLPSFNEVLAWFKNWWANILSSLTSWWNERLLDVRGLIQSELRDWFPFYDDLVNLWSSIKEFFVDPLGWLEAKFTDWFLGKE